MPEDRVNKGKRHLVRHEHVLDAVIAAARGLESCHLPVVVDHDLLSTQRFFGVSLSETFSGAVFVIGSDGVVGMVSLLAKRVYQLVSESYSEPAATQPDRNLSDY